MSKPVRVRFAPSPTGFLHVGGARTALYDYLFAKRHGGTFIFRVEDTDQERSTEESLRLQVTDLHWLGLYWDEGPDPITLADKGPYGPYRQSQRKHIYQEYLEKLLKSGHAFYCFMSEEESERIRDEAIARGEPGQVKSPFRDMTRADAEKKIAAGEKAVIRFRIPDVAKNYVIQDLVRGQVEFPSNMVGDFVLVRSDGMPVYNFCCVIDDALMKISHVLRAEEHLSNTLRQMMLYEAYGFDIPEFAHLSVVLGADKQKLSKRHGATSVGQYAEMGYLPSAINNFLALLGWSSVEGKELMSLADMIRLFSFDRVHMAPAVFDEVKLKWMNSQYLRELSNKEIWQKMSPFFAEQGLVLSKDLEWQDRAINLFRPYMETLKESVELFKPLSENKIIVEKEGEEVLKWDKAPAVIMKWRDLVAGFSKDYLNETEFLQIQDQVKTECQVKGKDLFMPIRTAVIGKPHGAELKILIPLLKKTQIVQRAQVVLEHCKGDSHGN